MKVELRFGCPGGWPSDDVHITIEGPAVSVYGLEAMVREHFKTHSTIYEEYEKNP